MSSPDTTGPRPDPIIAPGKRIFRGRPRGESPDTESPTLAELPDAPPWRRFTRKDGKDAASVRGSGYVAGEREITAVNVAMFLRRPLLVTGRPGAGKTTLAHAIAAELRLGRVLQWPITSRSTLQQGLYQYDAVARLHDASRPRPNGAPAGSDDSDIGRYLRLEPLGAALALSKPGAPRVLLIDEIDKSDIDLPNDLLHVFEEGFFEIPELTRLPEEPRFASIDVGVPGGDKVAIPRGRVSCTEFPIVVLTSNGERDFPPAFLRRCVRLDITPPQDPELARAELRRIVAARFDEATAADAAIGRLIAEFQELRDSGKRTLANDQLLNAVALAVNGVLPPEHPEFRRLALRDLADSGS